MVVAQQRQHRLPHPPAEGLILARPRASLPATAQLAAPGSEPSGFFLADPLQCRVAAVRADPVPPQHPAGSAFTPGAQLELALVQVGAVQPGPALLGGGEGKADPEVAGGFLYNFLYKTQLILVPRHQQLGTPIHTVPLALAPTVDPVGKPITLGPAQRPARGAELAPLTLLQL